MKKKITFFITLILIFTFVPSLLFIRTSAAGIDNLWDFNTSYCGYPDAKGNNYYSHLYQTSAEIKVKPGAVITFGPVYEGQELYLTLLDGNHSLSSRICKLEHLQDKTALGGGYICSYTIPAGVYFVRVTCTAAVFATFVITKDASFTAADYEAYTREQGLDFYTDFISADKSVLAGKKILWCGDSVGAGSYEYHYDGAKNAGITSNKLKLSWAGRMVNLLGLASYTNTSLGGSTYSTKHPTTNIPTQVKNNAKNYDIIIIEGGTVDCGGYNSIVVPLGYISDSYELFSFAGENTFIGGIERAFYYATTINPQAEIICVIPYSAPSNKNYNYGWERLYQYIPYVCEKWGIPCVNLYQNERVNAWFDYDRSLAGAYYYDNLHCTPLGYTATSVEIASVILSSGTYNAANRHMPENIPYIITKAAASEPVSSGEELAFDGNCYTAATAADGLAVSTSTKEKDIKSEKEKYTTSDYIAVKPGDTVYFGPCSPYESCQLAGYDSQKKSVTGALDSTSLAAVSYFNNSYIIYSYTVPDGVSYVRCSFLKTQSPVITVNQPFDSAFYNRALTAVKAGQAIDTAYTEAPVTTAEAVTEALTKEASESETDATGRGAEADTGAAAADTSTEGTSGAGTGGCASAASGQAIFAIIPFFSCIFLKRRKYN